MSTENTSFQTVAFTGLALDPVHVGTGGSRLGRVDNTIVRDPVTRIPKIPGSSLAGVMRAYVAMATEGKYPECAGLGQSPAGGKNSRGHCGQANCPVCTVFGFARGQDSSGGFAGLAAFSDMHVLLFPVATREGPHWVTAPEALRIAGIELCGADDDVVYRKFGSSNPLNMGWLMLPTRELDRWETLEGELGKLHVPEYIVGQVAVVSDRLFAYIVNCSLEVRTSVAINPATGAAEERALFTYEALPRGTVLYWEVVCRNPKHFQIEGGAIQAVCSPEDVCKVVSKGHEYLEHLGIGGMGSRGMGRLRVLGETPDAAADDPAKEGS